jgi:hypothetical protein
LDQRLINIEDIIYVRYQVSDPDLMERLLIDFGLLRAQRTKTTLYMRGTGEAACLHVSELGGDGRGGQCVRLRDPMGFQIAVHQGLMQHEPVPTRPAFITNAKGALRRSGDVCVLSAAHLSGRAAAPPRRRASAG